MSLFHAFAILTTLAALVPAVPAEGPDLSPAQPASEPARVTLMTRSRSTLMPAVSAADGYSPTARVRSPQRVWKSARCTSTATGPAMRAHRGGDSRRRRASRYAVATAA